MNRLTGIIGGIGAGKSVVCRILEAMGYPVYDCDSRAKTIMDADTSIHDELCAKIHPQAVRDGIIDRKLISEIVFADSSRLEILNAIVHGHVLEDLRQWTALQTVARCFVETAIPKSSGLDRLLDDAWIVTADDEERIARVTVRSHLTPQQIKARIEAQSAEFSGLACPTYTLRNNPDTPLLPQINSLI
ncbi:MAG: dephospho-CoA kinase [Muribaculaceae bacterium]|nr:dephospho-CoA kinase [Muribaculaceae bacterium]